MARLFCFAVISVALLGIIGCGGSGSDAGGMSSVELDAYNWHAAQSIDSAAQSTATGNAALGY